MNRSLVALFAASALALAACDDKSSANKPEDPASKNAVTTATSAAAPAPAAVAPVIADTDLSTPADFEETAEKAISKANYKTELAALETDIAKE